MRTITTVFVVCLCLTMHVMADGAETNHAATATMPWTPLQFSIWSSLRWLHLFPENWHVCGLRLNIPYGETEKSIIGIDTGLWGVMGTGIVLQANALLNRADKITGVQIAAVGGFLGTLPVHNMAGALVGVQVGGFGVQGAERLVGMQLSGIGNISPDCSGMQIAGIANNIWDNYDAHCSGVQLAGIYNHGGTIDGMQLAGIFNNCETTGSVQFAGIWNYAKNLRGVQFGCINIAESGVQFGLLNFNKNGFLPFFPFINFGTAHTTPTTTSIGASK